MRERSQNSTVTIRPYRPSDEEGWLRCSVLSFLHTAYFDSVFRTKPSYDLPAIELVADAGGMIAGVIDVECDQAPGSVCTICTEGSPQWRGGMIWHLAVHPDFQGGGIATRLLQAAGEEARERGLRCFEVWTRDDAATLRWYRARGFEWVKSYLHVYLEGRDEIEGAIQSSIEGLRPVSVFAHYSGPEREAIRARFRRVHECNCFRLDL